MAKQKEILELLKGYSLAEIAKIKLQDIAERKKALELEEQETMSFMPDSTKKTKKNTGKKLKVNKGVGGRSSSRQGMIRSIAQGKYMTVEEITLKLDWGKETDLPLQERKLKVHSAIKQMSRSGHMESRLGDHGYMEYTTIK